MRLCTLRIEGDRKEGPWRAYNENRQIPAEATSMLLITIPSTRSSIVQECIFSYETSMLFDGIQVRCSGMTAARKGIIILPSLEALYRGTTCNNSPDEVEWT